MAIDLVAPGQGNVAFRASVVENAETVLPVSAASATITRGGRRVLDEFSLTVGDAPGLVAILGPNGAGKTLALRVLAGLIMPDKGQVTWAGHPPDRSRVRRIGVVFQRPVMLKRSALENVAYALRVAGASRSDAVARAAAALEDAGLLTLAHSPARRLSGGEQQRLALARAMALDPELLFLDEPTANVDPASMAAIEDRLACATKRGLRIALVTQNIAQARRLADRVIFMHRGRVGEDGDAASFFAGPATDAARRYVAGEIVA
ncbi:MAG: ATP-binding cassette domain-containing protein [Hyphomicrobium sp.]|nr:ATP-binding cassette domain-containing protein [Hyphomicrobium sp.]